MDVLRGLAGRLEDLLPELPSHMYVCHHCGLKSDCNEPGWQERDGHVDCPNHLHADCRECRCHDIGTRYRLEYQGWSHELDLCPDHNPKRNRE